MTLSGQVAVVTGASRGIGKAIALAFAAQGASVVATATTLEGAKRVADEISAAGGKSLEAIPLTPAIRPVNIIMAAAARPISAPPINARPYGASRFSATPSRSVW